jgi:hypothetical protein
MEPEAEEIVRTGAFGKAPAEVIHTVAMVSISISLKRIADELTYQKDSSQNLWDIMKRISEKGDL